MAVNQNDSEKIPVERAGKPGGAWLELKGTILLYHTHSWLSTTSTFIPIEWISVEMGRRRDIRRLWLAIISLMNAFLFFLPAYALWKLSSVPEGDLWLMAPLAGASLLCLLGGAVLIVCFLTPRPLARLQVAGHPGGQTFEFWYAPGDRAALDQLLDRLMALGETPDERVGLPIRVHHLWRRPRPYRIALLKGILTSVLLYPVFFLWDLAAMRAQALPFPRLMYLLLLLPPAAYLAGALVRGGYRWREPRLYRRAVRAYLHNRGEHAEQCLVELLDQAPQHDASRFLLMQLYTERFAFAEAAQQCERLALEHPLLASRLHANLWELKRMHARMEEQC